LPSLKGARRGAADQFGSFSNHRLRGHQRFKAEQRFRNRYWFVRDQESSGREQRRTGDKGALCQKEVFGSKGGTGTGLRVSRECRAYCTSQRGVLVKRRPREVGFIRADREHGFTTSWVGGTEFEGVSTDKPVKSTNLDQGVAKIEFSGYVRRGKVWRGKKKEDTPSTTKVGERGGVGSGYPRKGTG